MAHLNGKQIDRNQCVLEGGLARYAPHPVKNNAGRRFCKK
jgi:hypothetical protein